MTPEDLSGVLVEVRQLRAGFAGTAPQPWIATTAAAEMIVQLGHLALCLLRRWGADTADLDDPGRPITDIGDELADVLLASLSVPTVTGARPAQLPPPLARAGSDGEVERFLRLLIPMGRLAEAAMMYDGFRHRSEGAPPSIPVDSAGVVGACETLADGLGVDVLAEFHAMVRDAEAFLRGKDTPR